MIASRSQFGFKGIDLAFQGRAIFSCPMNHSNKVLTQLQEPPIGQSELIGSLSLQRAHGNCDRAIDEANQATILRIHNRSQLAIEVRRRTCLAKVHQRDRREQSLLAWPREAEQPKPLCSELRFDFASQVWEIPSDSPALYWHSFEAGSRRAWLAGHAIPQLASRPAWAIQCDGIGDSVASQTRADFHYRRDSTNFAATTIPEIAKQVRSGVGSVSATATLRTDCRKRKRLREIARILKPPRDARQEKTDFTKKCGGHATNCLAKDR